MKLDHSELKEGGDERPNRDILSSCHAKLKHIQSCFYSSLVIHQAQNLNDREAFEQSGFSQELQGLLLCYTSLICSRGNMYHCITERVLFWQK